MDIRTTLFFYIMCYLHDSLKQTTLPRIFCLYMTYLLISYKIEKKNFNKFALAWIGIYDRAQH